MPWKKRPGMPRITRITLEMDATDQPVGRLATKIAMALMGKDRADYTPHTDMGAAVRILHADKVYFSGKKLEQKKYFRTSNRPGGLKAVPAQKMMDERPDEVIRHAVKYMLPKNKLQALRLKRLTFVK